MIQDLIEKYEKREKELKAQIGQDCFYPFDSGVVCGQLEMAQDFLKDLRELEGKPECEHEMDFVYGPEGDYQGTVCFKCAHTGE